MSEKGQLIYILRGLYTWMKDLFIRFSIAGIKGLKSQDAVVALKS